MNQFKSIEKEIRSFKWPFIGIAASGVLANIVIILLFVYWASPQEKKFSPLEACYYGLKSLFDNNPNEKLLNHKILNDVKARKFEIDKITLIKVINNYRCDVVVRDTEGYRSYKVELERNSKFPYFYKIFDIKGQKIISSYQWKGDL